MPSIPSITRDELVKAFGSNSRLIKYIEALGNINVNVQNSIINLTTNDVLNAFDLISGLLTVSLASSDDIKLPTGDATQIGHNSSIVNSYFDWSIINTNNNAVNVIANTNHDIIGSGSLNDTLGSGITARFRTIRKAANQYTTYRLS